MTKRPSKPPDRPSAPRFLGSRNRGKQKPKLADLSRATLTADDFSALMNALANPSPIAAAIIGAVMVEHELEQFVRRRLSRKDDDTWRELVSDRGPLGTFSQKIVLGYAFGIYDEATRDNLNVVRSIRNAFAHSKKLIDFDNELIIAELKKIKPSRRWKKHFHPDKETARPIFANLCLMLCNVLLREQVTALKISDTQRKRAKFKRLSPYAASLAPFLVPAHSTNEGSPWRPPPENQTSDPTSATPLGMLSGLFGPASKSDDSKDK
jgi:DNA-binding MltR family transcriptional regulator